MVFGDYVMASVRDPRDEMDFTIFGTLKSINAFQRCPSRIPISISSYERDRKALGAPAFAENGTAFGNDYHVGYMKRLEKWKNRIKSYSCNQQLCPALKERHERHILEKRPMTQDPYVQGGHSDPGKGMSNNSNTTTISGPSHTSHHMDQNTKMNHTQSYYNDVNEVCDDFNTANDFKNDEHSLRFDDLDVNKYGHTQNSNDFNNYAHKSKTHPGSIKNGSNMKPHCSDYRRNACTNSQNSSGYKLKCKGLYKSECVKPDDNTFDCNRQSHKSSDDHINNKTTQHYKKNGKITLNENSRDNNNLDIHGNNLSSDNYANNLRYKMNELFMSSTIRVNNVNEQLNNSYIQDDRNKSVPLKRTETRVLIRPTRNIYKDNVEAKIRQWLDNIPLYQSIEKNVAFDKTYVINALTEEINNLSDEFDSDQYEMKVKCLVDETLGQVPMWLPGQKRDFLHLFKNNYTDVFYIMIRELNQKLLMNRMNNVYHTTYKERNSRSHTCLMNDAVEDEIGNWVAVRRDNLPIPLDESTIIKKIMSKVGSLLQNPLNDRTSKFNLKCAIIEVLNEIKCPSCCCKIENTHLHRFSEELANILLRIQEEFEQSNNITRTISCSCNRKDDTLYTNANEKLIYREINKCLACTRLALRDDIKIPITEIIMRNIDSQGTLRELNIKKQIINVINQRSSIPENHASNIADHIIQMVRISLNQADSYHQTDIKPMLPRKISVYTTEEKCSMNFPITSTPKTIPKKEISKLNPEEMAYEEKVAQLIRSWIHTLPEQFEGEEEFKETIVKDLAGDITDQAKLEQLTTIENSENFRKYIVYRWIHKLNVFDLDEIKPQINDLICKVKDIPIPLLTRPQHGNRQVMTQLKQQTEDNHELVLPKVTDILGDEISIWMNKQTEMFDIDRDARNDKINKIVDILQEKLSGKGPSQEISNDIAQWLDGIVLPQQKNNIGQLADDLASRIIDLPQNATLTTNLAKKKQERAEYIAGKSERFDCCTPVQFNISDEDTTIVDKTMRQFISKFIEHHYDVDDRLARGAFSLLLKRKLQRLNPPKQKQVYEAFAKTGSTGPLPRAKLVRELDYIKDVSDWLRSIAIDPSFNTHGNRNRIDLVIDLAHNIVEIEEERDTNPDGMDYNMYMASVICQFLDQLPLDKDHRNHNYINFIMKQLLAKIIAHRSQNYNIEESIDASGIHDGNIGDFIEEFILVNCSTIADDELKLEAWSARIIDEIKKMVNENADHMLPKSQVYNKLLNVRRPGNETVEKFGNEIEYVKEISQWIKNLPLLSVDETDQQERVKMICELTEKVAEREDIKSNNPNDTKADSEFTAYIAKWISNLSLDASREVVVNMVIQQLLNRIEKVKSKKDVSIIPLDATNPNKNKNFQIPKINSKIKIKPTKPNKNPAGAMVDAIEKWSMSLPIQGCKREVNFLKNDASKKLYQTVGELYIDPRYFNDDILFEDVLSDKIDAVIEKLPQNPELISKKENLRNDLVQEIIKCQTSIKENTAGEHYKHKLENTIEASIPHSITHRPTFDPGFEIYKKRLAEMFILENFDHANDSVKNKFEREMRNKIDKFYDRAHISNNVMPSTKNEIYNELYSVLYRVPVPNKNSIVGEVEEIKTRCVIDSWFNDLPLEETNDLNELLKRDKIQAILAKHIHQIEKDISKQGDKIHKEIMKWLVKLPILPGPEHDLESLAKKLEKELRSTADQRKCVTTDPITKKKKKSSTNLNSKCKNKFSTKDIFHGSSPVVEPCFRNNKRAVDILMEIVDNWCLSLPIYSNRPQDSESNKMLKDGLVTKIVIKISELHMNPNIFNNDFLYENLLDEELDTLLRNIPTTCNFEDTKEEKKQQLKDDVRSTKQLFKDEISKHKYHQDLHMTVAKVLSLPKAVTPDKEAQYNELKEEIVENFVQFTYDKDDDKERQVYKMQIHDAVVKFVTEYLENKSELEDSLMLRNKLLCDLAKIPLPSKISLKDDVEEIRMKNEITELFEDHSVKIKDNLTNQVTSGLSKKLIDLEQNGYSPENELKMKQEVERHLKKLNKETKPQIINNFINKLRSNEAERRAQSKDKLTEIKTCKIDAIGVSTNTTPTNHPKPVSVDQVGETCFENCRNPRAVGPDERRKGKPRCYCHSKSDKYKTRKSKSDSKLRKICYCHDLKKPRDANNDNIKPNIYKSRPGSTPRINCESADTESHVDTNEDSDTKEPKNCDVNTDGPTSNKLTAESEPCHNCENHDIGSQNSNHNKKSKLHRTNSESKPHRICECLPVKAQRKSKNVNQESEADSDTGETCACALRNEMCKRPMRFCSSPCYSNAISMPGYYYY